MGVEIVKLYVDFIYLKVSIRVSKTETEYTCVY